MVDSCLDTEGLFLDSVLDEAALVVIRLRSVLADGEDTARAYLTTLPPLEADSLGRCLKRLGWWLPDDKGSVQDLLVWWLFLDDVTRMEVIDGQECHRRATPQDRIRQAVDGIIGMASAATIPAESCLAVARFVRTTLEWMNQGGMQLPLERGVRQCGTPAHIRYASEGRIGDGCIIFDGPLATTQAISDIRFDGECLNNALNAAASQLGLPPKGLEWRTSKEYTAVVRAYKDVESLLTHWGMVLDEQIQTRKELPPGWEFIQGSTAWPQRAWPMSPIQNVEQLRGWLSGWLGTIHKVRASSSGFVASPDNYLDYIRRELRNSLRAMEDWGLPLPAEFDEDPADIHKAERQLKLLIDGPLKPVDEVKPEATSEPPKPGKTPTVIKHPQAKKTQRKQARTATLVEAAVRSHHKFEGGIVDNSIPAITGRVLADQYGGDGKFSASAADRWFRDRFGSKEAYELCCENGELGMKLAVKGDDVKAFGTFSDMQNLGAVDNDQESNSMDCDEFPKNRPQSGPSVKRKF